MTNLGSHDRFGGAPDPSRRRRDHPSRQPANSGRGASLATDRRQMVEHQVVEVAAAKDADVIAAGSRPSRCRTRPFPGLRNFAWSDATAKARHPPQYSRIVFRSTATTTNLEWSDAPAPRPPALDRQADLHDALGSPDRVDRGRGGGPEVDDLAEGLLLEVPDVRGHALGAELSSGSARVGDVDVGAGGHGDLRPVEPRPP